MYEFAVTCGVFFLRQPTDRFTRRLTVCGKFNRIGDVKGARRMRRKTAWVDTIRVLASFIVIFAHFFMCESFTHQARMGVRLYEFAAVCIPLFFAISGYLIHPSLERTPSLTEFYKKKIVRLTVPFTVCYLVMSVGMTLLSLLNEHFMEKVPLYHAAFGARYFMVLLGMFPVDLNLMKFLGWEPDWFTGEWFMGVILLLFLVAPILDKGAVRAPILTMAAAMALSFAAFYGTEQLVAEGKIYSNITLFVVRIPEFLFGMILCIHREKLLRIRRYLVGGTVVYLTALIGLFVATYPFGSELGATLFELGPSSFVKTLPVVYLLFTLAEWLNEHAGAWLDWFNGFSGVSYMAMLSQHMVIYAFESSINFGELHSFGRVYILLLITLVIVFISRRMQAMSDPIEKWFLRRRDSN